MSEPSATRASIRAAACQFVSTSNIDANLSQIRDRMREANDRGCHVLTFHEGALTGYRPRASVDELDFSAIRAAEQAVQALAAELGLAVLVGSIRGDASGRLFNDVLIVDEVGRVLGRYAKTWRAGEPTYAPGSGPVIFELAGVTATAIICHDLRYPEMVRLPVIAGARLLFIVNNESGLTHEDKLLGYRSMQIARATENGIYAVMANAAADPLDITGEHQSHGHSKIIDPLGNVLDEAGAFEQRLVIADLDLANATAEPARRTVGHSPHTQHRNGPAPEHPHYARWMCNGLSLVRRLAAPYTATDAITPIG